MSTARTTFFLVLSAISSPAAADGTVGYKCDHANDRIVLTYESSDRSASETLESSDANGRWDPGSLIEMLDEDHIGKLNSVKKQCRLSDGKYTVTISPVPGNLNIQRGCGGWMTAQVTVRKGSRLILSHYKFETGCLDTESPITTRIVFNSRTATPTFTTVSNAEFYK